MSGDPIAVINRLADAIRANDAEAAANTYAEDVILVDPRYNTVGRDGARDAFEYWLGAFEVKSFEIAETIVQGSRVAVHLKWSALHRGEYMGVSATNQLFSGWNVALFDTRDGYVSRDLSVWDCTQLLALQELASRSEERV
jgi:predicted ester cyclase